MGGFSFHIHSTSHRTAPFSRISHSWIITLWRDTEERQFAFSIYEFNRYLKAVCKNDKLPGYYQLDTRAIDFLTKIDKDDLISENNILIAKVWDKYYQTVMNIFRDWLKESGPEVLQKLNDQIFKLDWIKYASGNYSAWEMEVLCFYHHPAAGQGQYNRNPK